MSDERRRISAAYRRRMEAPISDRYSPFSPGQLYMMQRHEEEALRMLRNKGIRQLAGARILEVGCGRGERFVDWIRWGTSAASLHGVDLMEPFIRRAAGIAPSARLVVGAADQLPYRDASFDIVAQRTVFTSILDPTMKRAAAAEMCRVLAPDGLIVWYDFRYSNPRNPDVRGIDAREVRDLFPGWEIDGVTLTLLPPLARRLAPVSFGACRMLEALLPPARTHYLAAIRRART